MHVSSKMLLVMDTELEGSLQTPPLQHVTSQMAPPYLSAICWQIALVFLEHAEGYEHPLVYDLIVFPCESLYSMY